MNPALHRGWRKAVRDLLQAVAAVAASGGTVALVDAITGSVDPVLGVVLAFVFKIAFAFLMNWAETSGKIPVLLPTPGLTPSTGVVSRNVGVVETTIDKVGDAVGNVEGVVTDTAGGLLGEVVDVDQED